MTEVIIEEPKSITEKVEQYKCDRCGYVGGDDELHTYEIRDDDVIERGHLCVDCSEAKRYATLVEMRTQKKRLADLISVTIEKGSLTTALGLGVTVGTTFTYIVWQEVLISHLSGGGLGLAFVSGTLLTLLAAGIYANIVVSVKYEYDN